ncbi:hypothetical protein G4Y79_05105 [Phototrophicus methaneseepsis]|uniref:Uncharacterized protein n=1 Tax=Phototrophicus methaneseepsis TaxID=2710758 RepID=A0A7S8IG92_9CHLR|nr:hypothetical protein [Phototrophicus methaneseepsis]QPC83758.1 hypothetical protein G4Y79_05105 [Phototrophicus methaneseepsis]
MSDEQNKDIQPVEPFRISQTQEQFMADIRRYLDKAWTEVESKEAQNALLNIWQLFSAIFQYTNAVEDHANKAEFVIEAQMGAIEEMTRQRDAALDEYADLLTALDHLDTSHPDVRKVYTDILAQLKRASRAS